MTYIHVSYPQIHQCRKLLYELASVGMNEDLKSCRDQWMSFGIYGALSTYDMSTTTKNGQEMDETSGISYCAVIYRNLVIGVGLWLESSRHTQARMVKSEWLLLE